MEHSVRLRRFKPFTSLLPLALVGFVLICLCVPIARAATFSVTKTADTNDGACTPADCSLREAISVANATAGVDTINLPGGTYTISIANVTPNENGNATGDFDVTDNLSIVPAGDATPIIDAVGLDRVFELRNLGTADINVQMTGITMRNGTVADSGGGVFIGSGTNLTLVSSTVQGNRSTGGDGGGGIYIQGSASLNLLTSSVISNTSTTNGGGGIKNNNVLLVRSSTVSGNTTIAIGGGISNNNTATISNSTIVNNRADSGGGGILSASNNVLNIRNTILAGNTDGSNQPRDCSGTLTSQGYNLIQSVANCTIAGDVTGNITGVNPNLGPLAANGGPTLTHALLSGSLAIDAGSPAPVNTGGNSCEAIDQRQFPRPQDGDGNGTARCDMGAFEREPPGATATTTPVTPTGTAISPTPTGTVASPSTLRIYLPIVVR